MTTGELQALCEREMEKAKADLSAGGFKPYAVIVSRTGRESAIPLPDSMMGSRKQLTYQLLGATCRDIDAQALLIAGDAWTLIFSEEEKKRVAEDREYRDQFLAAFGTRGCREMAAAGWGTLGSQIVCQAQTPREFIVIAQPYDMVDSEGCLIPATANPGETPYTVRFSHPAVTITSEMGGQMEGMAAVFYEGQRKPA